MGTGKQEMLKRHESPRSRRQLINNLAMAQTQGINKPAQKVNNRLLSGNQGLGMTQQFSAQNSADLTFFDNKMFANKPKTQRKFTSGLAGGSTDQAPHFFNKSGPIKIPHNRPNQSTQSQVEDLFQPEERYGATQKINNLELGEVGGRQMHRAQQKQGSLGSRRELNQTKPLSAGQVARPGTAPQQMNVLLSSNSQAKPNRPMSPFTKVYTNQLGKQTAALKPKKSASQDPRRRTTQPPLPSKPVRAGSQRTQQQQPMGFLQMGNKIQPSVQGRGNMFGPPGMMVNGSGPQFYQQPRGNSPYERQR